MTLKTIPSEAFVDVEEDEQQREEILEEDLPSLEEGIVHYYESEEGVEDEQVRGCSKSNRP